MLTTCNTLAIPHFLLLHISENEMKWDDGVCRDIKRHFAKQVKVGNANLLTRKLNYEQ